MDTVAMQQLPQIVQYLASQLQWLSTSPKFAGLYLDGSCCQFSKLDM